MKQSPNHKKSLSQKETALLFTLLETRFIQNLKRHKGIVWADVAKKLKSSPEKVWSLNEMEKTGGEPDVVGYDKKTNEYVFYDCSPESPLGRRSVCYDHEARKARKEHQPECSAIEMADHMGVTLLTETQYQTLQKLGAFDLKTSSWIVTPTEIRTRGGALFADYRYGNVFVYHNGAPSYYAARGFRAELRV